MRSRANDPSTKTFVSLVKNNRLPWRGSPLWVVEEDLELAAVKPFHGAALVFLSVANLGVTSECMLDRRLNPMLFVRNQGRTVEQ